MPESAPCEFDACIETCRAVEEAREADLGKSFDTRLRSTRCSADGCLVIFELESDCYVKSNELDVSAAQYGLRP